MGVRVGRPSLFHMEQMSLQAWNKELGSGWPRTLGRKQKRST
jgi:hypothetical protein